MMKFAHTLWGKIYRGDIWRIAAEQMSDNVFPCALDDLYTFFVISFFSSSYCGIPKEFLYVYREYIGMSAGATSTLRSVRLLPALEDFLRRQNALAANSAIMQTVSRRLYDCGIGILMRIREIDSAVLEEAADCWGRNILLDFIAQLGVFNVRVDDRRMIIPRLAQAVNRLQSERTA